MKAAEIVNSVAKCVQSIDGGQSINRRFDDQLNMVEKYKLATQLAGSCRQIGYDADIGYQTLLYENDKEIRKLFVFLIERLPKEEASDLDTIVSSDTGSLEQRFAKIPVNLNPNTIDTNQIDDDCERVVFDPFVDHDLFTDRNLNSNKPSALKHFLTDHYRPPLHDIAWLIRWNGYRCRKERESHLISVEDQSLEVKVMSAIKLSESPMSSPMRRVLRNKRPDADSKTQQSKGQASIADHEQEDQLVLTLQQEVDELEQQLAKQNAMLEQLQLQSQQSQAKLADREDELAMKTRELQLLQKNTKDDQQLGEEIVAMKEEIGHMKQKWRSMHEQFDERMQQSRQEQQERLKQSSLAREELETLKRTITERKQQMSQCERTHQQLTNQIAPQSTAKRAYFVKRILDINQSVRKQSIEANRTLLDIQKLQKDISNLLGRVQRTYTMTDELLYRVRPNNQSPSFNSFCSYTSLLVYFIQLKGSETERFGSSLLQNVRLRQQHLRSFAGRDRKLWTSKARQLAAGRTSK
jgi:hypothetical protein